MKQVWLVLATYDILRQKIRYKLMEPGHDANNYIYSWDDRGASWCALGFLGKSRERRYYLTRRPPWVYTREKGADNRWLMTDIPQDPSKAILASKTFTIPSPEPPWLGEVDPVAQSFLLPFRK